MSKPPSKKERKQIPIFTPDPNGMLAEDERKLLACSRHTTAVPVNNRIKTFPFSEKLDGPLLLNPWLKKRSVADFLRVVVFKGAHQGVRAIAESQADTEDLLLHVYELVQDPLQSCVFPSFVETITVSRDSVLVLHGHILASLADEVEFNRVIDAYDSLRAEAPPGGVGVNPRMRVMDVETGLRYCPDALDDGATVVCRPVHLCVKEHATSPSFKTYALRISPPHSIERWKLFHIDGQLLGYIEQEIRETTLLATSGRTWPNHYNMPVSSYKRSQFCCRRRVGRASSTPDKQMKQ